MADEAKDARCDKLARIAYDFVIELYLGSDYAALRQRAEIGINDLRARRPWQGIAITAMDWHPTPKDNAWRQAHLAMLERLGKDAWLRCDGCAHTVMVKPRELAELHGLDMLTPLLTISRRMRCTRCGARKGGCRPAPHDTRQA
jgi:DNA-directed RNA polymerase subunit RPC12/RpoP